MPSICWLRSPTHGPLKTNQPWLRLDFCEMSKKFSASGVPKTLGRPSSYFHRAVGGTQGVWGKGVSFLKVDPKPGENVGFKGLKVWWLVGWSFSSDASFFFRVFFWWWCFSLAKEKLKLYNSCFFFWSGSRCIYTNTILYNLYIKDCYRTSNPLKKTALFVVCLVFF